MNDETKWWHGALMWVGVFAVPIGIGHLIGGGAPATDSLYAGDTDYSVEREYNSAGRDLDCDDFDWQSDAQDELDGGYGDPNGLDRDGDGVACETLP